MVESVRLPGSRSFIPLSNFMITPSFSPPNNPFILTEMKRFGDDAESVERELFLVDTSDNGNI